MKTAHVIGIGGIGMSATALLLRDMGYQVSGSDEEIYDPVKGLLAHEGLTPKLGFSPSNIQGKPDLILLGRNAKLDPKTNAEVRHALELNTNVRTFPEVIGEAAKGRHTIVSAGSFGKSTTTALLTWILMVAKRDPGYFIGAVAKNLPRTAMLGTGREFVIEGDEYPTAHGDSRPKFMHYHPDDVLLTSVVHDHVNVYPTFESYRRAFEDLVALMPASGILFACADEPEALAFAKRREDSVTYGLNSGDWTARDIRFGNPTRFTLAQGGVAVCELETSQIGRHNIENIVGAAAVAIERRLASIADVQKAIASFDGLRRRLDQIAPQSSVHVIEGFGSSEEKARSAIDAVLLHYPKHPLVVFFEPHTFSWRNRAALPWYDRVFAGAAHVHIAPPASQGAATHEQLTHQEILERVRKAGVEASPFTAAQTDAAVAALKGNEVVLILTSGDLGGAIPKIADAITKRFPK